MSLQGISLFKVASDRMAYLATRSQLVSENVANADTPKFVAKDLKPFEAALEAARFDMANTDPGHLQDLPGNIAHRLDAKARAWEVAPSGNGVVLEQEMLKGSEIRADYTLIANIYQKSHQLLSMALGVRG